jgi:hypothetical protein
MPDAINCRAPALVREIFRQTTKKITAALPKTRFENINSVKARLSKDFEYLREVVDGVQIQKRIEYEMLKMSPGDLSSCKLFYDASRQILLSDQGDEASTVNKSSKGLSNIQAFVLDKQKNIYMVTHKGYFSTQPNFTHASFLQSKPLEMAGMIVIEKGKINGLSDDSGHYAPDALDMYLGIKKIQKAMPNVFHSEAKVFLRTHPRPLLIKEFISSMEQLGLHGRCLYEKLLLQRINCLLEEAEYITKPKSVLKIKSDQGIEDIIANLQQQEALSIKQALESGQGLNLVIQPNPKEKLISEVYELNQVAILMMLHAKDDLAVELAQKNRFDVMRKILINSYEKGDFAQLANKIFANQDVADGIMEYELLNIKSSSILHFAAYNLDEDTVSKILHSKHGDKLLLHKDHNNLMPLEYAKKHRHMDKITLRYENTLKAYRIAELLKHRAKVLELAQKKQDLAQARLMLQIQEDYIPPADKQHALDAKNLADKSQDLI